MALASLQDVQLRLGRTLSASEVQSVTSLLDASSAVIESVVGPAADLDPVPPVVAAVCVNMTLRGLANPMGFASDTESLGAYSKSQTYNNASTGIEPTQAESLLLQRAIWGTTTASGRLEPTLLMDIAEAEGS